MPPIKRKSTMSSDGASSSPTIPGLRRAPTFTLDSDSSSSSKHGESLVRRTSSKISLKSKSSVASLSKKASFVREGSGICSSIIGLESGSSVGKTGSMRATAVDGGYDVVKVASRTVDECGSKTSAAVETLRKSLSEVNELIKTTSMSKAPSITKIPSVKKTPSLSKTPSVRSEKSIRQDDVSTAPPLPPGGLIEIAFSFNTTGSMYGYLTEVRGRIKDMVQRLQADIPGIRIAIIAHGDYWDKDNYIVKWIDFGASVPELYDFVENVSATSGGDADECYELVLRRTQEVLSWTPGSQRSLVLIGDASPHEPGYIFGDFKNDINWRQEAVKLRDMGVRIYSVGAGGAEHIPFYKVISKVTGGRFLPLKNFNVIFDMLMTICYMEGGADLFEAYESEVRGRDTPIDTTLDGMFKAIREDSSTSFSKATGLKLPKAKSLTKLSLGSKSKTLTGKLGAKGAKKITSKVVSSKTTKNTSKRNAVSSKRTKSTSKRKGKEKAKKVERQKREGMTDTRFAKGPLKRLKWSRWMLAVSPIHIAVPSKEIGKHISWNLTSWSNGFCNKAILTKKETTNVPAVYEFAVRLPHKKKRYPVFWRMTTGIPKSSTWFGYLLSQKRIRNAVKEIISKRGEILVRRGTFKRKNNAFMQKVSKHIWGKYDYAWVVQRKNSKCRNLKRCGFDISNERF